MIEESEIVIDIGLYEDNSVVFTELNKKYYIAIINRYNHISRKEISKELFELAVKELKK